LTAIIRLLLIVAFLSGCNVVFGGCDPADSLPYSENEVVHEPHCSSKCCEYVIYKESKMCFEIWCFRDCQWTMNHSSCY